jgi:hypothetical protein
MIKLQLINAYLIDDTDTVTSRVFRKSFNCRYNPRMTKKGKKTCERIERDKIHLWCKSIVKTLHYFQGMESYEQCGQGRSYCSLCTLDTIHRLFFVTRLIINKINKVQLADFKLENVLVSLHSLKTMGLAPFGASAQSLCIVSKVQREQ